MQYIVFDIEHVSTPNFRKQSIIEIGAIKLDSSLAPKDYFHTFVKPKNPNIYDYEFISDLTGINLTTIKDAPNLPEVIENFQRWIGFPYNTEYLLCVWGNYDIRVLVDDHMQNNINPYWIINFNDIQPSISNKLTNNKNKRISLLSAANTALNIDNFLEHSAIDDAWITALLFIEYFNVIELKKNSFNYNMINKTIHKEKFYQKPFADLDQKFKS